MTVPSSMVTYLSQITRRRRTLRPMLPPCIRIDSSMSQKLWTKTLLKTTELCTRPPEMIAPLAMMLSIAMPRAALGVEDELHRRVLQQRRADRPGVVVEIEQRRDAAQVHVGVEVRVDGADVAPVAALAIALAGDGVVEEVVGVDRVAADHRRDHVLAEVVRRAARLRGRRAGPARARRCRRCSCPSTPAPWSGSPGIGLGSAGFSSKPMMRQLLVDLDDAELAGGVARGRRAGRRPCRRRGARGGRPSSGGRPSCRCGRRRRRRRPAASRPGRC